MLGRKCAVLAALIAAAENSYPLSSSAGTARPPVGAAEQRCDLVFEGGIERGDAGLLEQMLPADSGSFVLCLSSNGGLLSEGIRMSEILSEKGVASLVLDGHACLSACAIAFLGGTCRAYGDAGVYEDACRFASAKSRIGYHAPFLQELERADQRSFTSDEVREIWSISRLASGQYAEALFALGVPMNMIVDFLAKGADESYEVDTIGRARNMGIIVPDLPPAHPGPDVFIDTCENVLKFPEDARRQVRSGDTEFKLTEIESYSGRTIIAAQLTWVNYPYATWRVCRIHYSRNQHGFYPDFAQQSGAIQVESCERIILTIPESLEMPVPAFRLDRNGVIETVGPVMAEDECRPVASYYGAHAQMWMRPGDTPITRQ